MSKVAQKKIYTNVTANQTPDFPIFNMKSDTVTLPTIEMREAMFFFDDFYFPRITFHGEKLCGEVGDDVSVEDPTVLKLEQMVADFFGKEAGLFVTSGTQGNLISVLTHCSERGSEFIVGDLAHIYYYEQGGSATLGGCHPRVLKNNVDGTIDLHDIEHAIRGEDDHYPITRLVCLENTHNKAGGTVLSPEYINQVADICQAHDLKLHVDGARIMNAIAYYPDIDPVEYLSRVDTMSVCLSKGLGAPLGSVVIGDAKFIKSARRLRKALGGGMRQVGIVAAPAIIAFDKMRHGLSQDHSHASLFAEKISQYDGITIAAPHETNIVFFDVDRPEMNGVQFVELCKEQNLMFGSYGDHSIRAVFHYDIKPEHLDVIFARLDSILKN